MLNFKLFDYKFNRNHFSYYFLITILFNLLLSLISVGFNLNKVMMRSNPLILAGYVSLWEIFFVLCKELIDFNALIEIIERFLKYINLIYTKHL